jgi:hypothetical protein
MVPVFYSEYQNLDYSVAQLKPLLTRFHFQLNVCTA